MKYSAEKGTLPSTPVDHPPLLTRTRIANVDILRGLVMIVMALDHVRDLWSATPYRPEDVTQASVLLFVTRWITHFCAPTFVFLSGVSIYLYASKKASKRQVSRYLLTRGLWLVVLEVVVISFLLQYAYQIILIQVIWVIGWSMVILSALIWLPRKAILILGCAIIALHNLIPNIQPVTASNILPAILHNSPFVVHVGPLPILVAYTIFPWAGVMMVGYGIGNWFTRSLPQQNRLLVSTGISLIILFAVLRFLNVYGDPSPWDVQSRGPVYTFLSFLNVTKYPPSLLFLSLTLGTALLLLAWFNTTSSKATEIMKVYGKVPFFYYVLHLAIIVAGAYAWTYLSFNTIVNFAFMPQTQWPAAYEPSLLRTYVVWALVVALLYLPCRWYARYKATHGAWWLTYL